jgi:hypothetical protein
MKEPKVFAQLTRHAHSRAQERYGVSFAQLKKLSMKIVEGNARFAKEKGEHEIYIVAMGRREIPVVWDARNKTIVTVLPKHALRELHRELNK